MLLAWIQTDDTVSLDTTKNLLSSVVVIKLDLAHVLDILNVIFICLACFLQLKLGNNSRT
jgi:hypothetical protein